MMSRIKQNIGFYGILSDPLVGYVELTKIFIKHHVPFIQLRMKKSPLEEVRAVALELVRLTRGTNSKFILNDEPLLAKEVGADGVHLGQTNMPYLEARTMLGPDAIIGLSTHNVEQVVIANQLRPDYIGMGPVYPTPTKEKPDPVIGTDGLKKMMAANTLPYVAIGGIDLTHIMDVKATGATSICVVRWVNDVEDPISVLEKIKYYYPW